MDIFPNKENIIKSISILNRTRESLTASGGLSDSEGQLLEKALAKQLYIRKCELDSSIPNSVSVIVRASTPNPEEICEENCSRRFFSTPARSPNPNPSSLAPEDYNLPLRTFLQELPEDCSDIQIVREPVINHSTHSLINVAEGFEESPLAPTVPWSPPRHSSLDSHEPISILLTATNTAHLLAPLITEKSSINSVVKKMEDSEKDCNTKVRRFKSSLRLTDPNGINQNTNPMHIFIENIYCTVNTYRFIINFFDDT